MLLADEWGNNKVELGTGRGHKLDDQTMKVATAAASSNAIILAADAYVSLLNFGNMNNLECSRSSETKFCVMNPKPIDIGDDLFSACWSVIIDIISWLHVLCLISFSGRNVYSESQW